jgi:hypothetical protein
MQHYVTMAAKLTAGKSLTGAETDWAAMFDASDPGVTILTFPA